MAQPPVLVDLDAANFESLPCCGVVNESHSGRCDKNKWLKTYLKKGLRAKVMLGANGRQCGYIEYLPGEYAWRGVEARGYLFIHCLWTHYKANQHQGYGSRMIQACVEDAAAAGMHGVAVVAREEPWLASAAVFLKNGFEVVDTAPPDYQLLIRKLNSDAANPRFKSGWEDRLKKYGQGLTIIRSNQCSHIAKFADEIAQTAEQDYGIKPTIVQIKSHRDAQNAPTPYAVFALIRDGVLLADHQISCTRFHNIMNARPR
ncbi:GNAT family N-acetyltransferase [Paludibaculum fermentans]|uniref:GNAT family N-acetyltransferase n=1 Tax=Paludibaculum fermentans TaxID=1473598 RepID=A0A7S7NTW8_PALFE|nr:GNAT family N-acetyltransferase [Paludibaculum fermentans]QOY89735.1 GNAT family N-acetyltransferase [Paludibaculum fermentans]